MLKRVAAFLFILTVISPVMAITVTPGSYSVEFKPNKTIYGNCATSGSPGCLCLRLSEVEKEDDVELSLSVTGEMADTLRVEEKRFDRTMGPYDCYVYDIVFGDKARYPGENIAYVGATVSYPGDFKATVGIRQTVRITSDAEYAEESEPFSEGGESEATITKDEGGSKMFLYGGIAIAPILLAVFLLISRRKKNATAAE